jgi:hypothetical protein
MPWSKSLNLKKFPDWGERNRPLSLPVQFKCWPFYVCSASVTA